MSSQKSNTNQAIWVALSSLTSFGATLLTSMILSRELDKIDYGTYNQVMYVYNTLLVVFAIGLPNAFSYFLPRESEQNVRHLINKINRVLLILGAIFSLVLFFGAATIAGLLKNSELKPALQIFALVPLFMLPTIGLEGILSTFRKTHILTIFMISTRCCTVALVTLPILIWNLSYEYALIGFTISAFITFALAMYLKYYPTRGFLSRGTTRFKYKDIFAFSFPLMIAGFWGIIIKAADQFFISRYFGTKIFAEFSNGSIELPFVAMIIGATSVVLTPLFSKKMHEQENAQVEILRIWRSVFEKTIKLIYPMVVFCFVFGTEIMTILFGESYIGSSDYFRIKLLVNFFTIISYSPIILALGATRYYNRVHMFGALLLIAAELLAVYTIRSPYAITLISVICQILRIVAMLHFISRYFNMPLLKLTLPKLQLEVMLASVILLIFIRSVQAYVMRIENPMLILATGLVFFLPAFYAWTRFRKLDYAFVFNFLIPGKKTQL